MIGVGGNLVAVQASRLSTALHQQGKPGEFRNDEEYQASGVCPNPYKVFCSTSMDILFVNYRSVFFKYYRKQFIDNTGFIIYDYTRSFNIYFSYLAISY
jgi:hypothetical protein